jgi:hypothetical protein
VASAIDPGGERLRSPLGWEVARIGEILSEIRGDVSIVFLVRDYDINDNVSLVGYGPCALCKMRCALSHSLLILSTSMAPNNTSFGTTDCQPNMIIAYPPCTSFPTSTEQSFH